MSGNGFTQDTFQTLFDMLGENGTAFKAFFTQDENTGNWIFSGDLTAYYTFLEGLGVDDPSTSVFADWDAYVNGKSQGAGNL